MNCNVFIELGNDGTYGAYIGGKNPLPFGVIGEGNTVAEAKRDFLDVVEAYKADGEKVPDDVEFVFSYDVPSFLSYYSKRLSLAGLWSILQNNRIVCKTRLNNKNGGLWRQWEYLTGLATFS